MSATIATQLTAFVGTLMLAIGPMTLAYWLLTRRKRLVRSARHSPLGEELLRSPGHSLREQIEDLQLGLLSDVATLIFVPLMPVAFLYLLARMESRFAPLWVEAILFVGVATFVVKQVRSMLEKGRKLDRLRLGLDAELAVAEELNQLMRHGAVVFHDIEAERFNIDHVVVAPQGVFAIESKGYSKETAVKGQEKARISFDGKQLATSSWRSSAAIDQARRQTDWLSQWLSNATGDQIAATSVLALPGWYVERQGRGSVHVLSGKELRGLLKIRSAQPLSAAEMQRAVHQIEQRCRTAKPLYRPNDD